MTSASHAPPAHRPVRLGLVAYVLSMVAVVGSLAAGLVVGFVTASAQSAAASVDASSTATWTEMSDAAELWVIVAAGSGVLWALLGIAGLALGIVAIVRRSRRGLGIAAVVAAALAPGVGIAAFTLAALAVATS